MSGALGIFGGSFDPPHLGHVLTACYALSIGEISELWVVPTFSHPFGKSLRSFEHRLRMCELAFEPLRHCSVSALERELGGTSFTTELLEAVRQRVRDRPLRFILGTDILGQTDRWHRFDRIVELAPPLFVQRGGHLSAELPAGAAQMPEISSTEVRARLQSRRPVVGLVPGAVADYAREYQLYEEPP